MTPMKQITVLNTQRAQVLNNDKRERLFISGLMLVAFAIIVWFVLWSVGVTPASTQEREFISMLRDSEFAKSPKVGAVLAEVDASAYTSRRHFMAAEGAYTLASR